MSFRYQAKKMVGQTVRVQLTSGRTLTGKLSSVGTDFMVMHVRIGGKVRRVIVRIAEILLLFALLGL